MMNSEDIEIIDFNEDDKKKKKKSKKGLIIIIVIVLIIAAVGGYFGYNYFKSLNNTKNANVEKKKQADRTKDILNILGLTEDGLKEKNKFDPYSIQTILFSLNNDKEVMIDEANSNLKLALIYRYAISNSF